MIFLGLFSLLLGCTSSDADLQSITIKGRHRTPLYRAYIPASWKVLHPPEGENLADTTKAICKLQIFDPGGGVAIAIHNFPAPRLDKRIPPEMQVARWERQLESKGHSEPDHVGGFIGLCFWGETEAKGILAWSLQVAATHFTTLSALSLPEEVSADVTIKASGPCDLIDKYRRDLVQFVHSFHLIQEIPSKP